MSNVNLIQDAVQIISNGISMVPVVGNIISGSINVMTSSKQAWKHFKDEMFVRKLISFLNIENLDENWKKEAGKFIESFGENKDRVIASIVHYINTTEDEEKASILGHIYTAAVFKEIDKVTMFRLWNIVNKCFILDLSSLPRYVKDNDDDSEAAQSFINLGLIDNNQGESWGGSPLELNDIGIKLYNILDKAKWFDNYDASIYDN